MGRSGHRLPRQHLGTRRSQWWQWRPGRSFGQGRPALSRAHRHLGRARAQRRAAARPAGHGDPGRQRRRIERRQPDLQRRRAGHAHRRVTRPDGDLRERNRGTEQDHRHHPARAAFGDGGQRAVQLHRQRQRRRRDGGSAHAGRGQQPADRNTQSGRRGRRRKRRHRSGQRRLAQRRPARRHPGRRQHHAADRLQQRQRGRRPTRRHHPARAAGGGRRHPDPRRQQYDGGPARQQLQLGRRHRHRGGHRHWRRHLQRSRWHSH